MEKHEAAMSVQPTAVGPALPQFEANLIRILRFFLRRSRASEVLPLIFRRCARPPCLSRACVRIVQDTLARGCIRLLARGDGWRRTRHLRGNQIVDGFLWQRSTPTQLSLSFSRHTLELLLWFTAEDPSDGKSRRRKPPLESLTAGDTLFCYHVYTALRNTPVGGALTNRLGFGTQPLCWLAFPEDFTARPPHEKPDFTLWTHGVGACMLEALQSELTERWLQVERGKRQLDDWQSMQALGTSQERVLDAFMGVLETTGRRDLARFLLAALNKLVPADVCLAHWFEGMQEPGRRLADRAATYHKGLVLLRQLERFRRWEAQAREVGYFDEDYAAAQLWKAEWERFQGQVLCQRAEVVLRQLERGPRSDM
jgi:hypothetical protein